MSDDLTTITVVENEVAEWYCHHCGEGLDMVVDPTSGVVDWGASGDFGCDDNPESNEDGSAPHAPTLSRQTFHDYWLRQRAWGWASLTR
jgi:hypothetical protein